MKVVLDTNCILQIVFPLASYKEVWDALIARKYTICVTNDFPKVDVRTLSEFLKIVKTL